MGAPHPKEVVTDASRALLTAVIKEYTCYPTIEQYADACRNTVPRCYIRIDVAHFIKTYSNALKSTLRPVRTFYLAVIGQLVLCRQIEDARKILKALFVISQCELEGNLEGSRTKSDCETQKQFLEHLITGKEMTYDEEEYNNEKSIPKLKFDEDEQTEISSNWWSKWGEEINYEIQDSISQKGTRANAHYAPHITNKLLRDISTIPLWSNIYTDKFGYGRIPASSASVEGEFNKLKNLVINKPLRVDKFVEEHIKYLIGRVIIADADIQPRKINLSTNIKSSTYSRDSLKDEHHEFQDTSNFTQKDMSLLENTEKELNLIKTEDVSSTSFSKQSRISDSIDCEPNMPQILNEICLNNIEKKTNLDLTDSDLSINDHTYKEYDNLYMSDKENKRLLSISANNKADVIFIAGHVDFTDREYINKTVKAIIIDPEKLSENLAILIRSIQKNLEEITSYKTVCGIRNKTLIINLPGMDDNVCIAAIADILINTLHLIRKKDENKESLLARSANADFLDSSDNNVSEQEWMPLISLDEALIIFRDISTTSIIKDNESVKISDAYGRILLENIYSKYNVPSFRTSKKHGYAVLVSDGKGMRQVLNNNNTFPPISLQCGTCVWVKSGAPVPNEATAVIEEKNTKRIRPHLDNDKVYIEIMSIPRHGQNINPIGYHTMKEKLILKQYTRIGPEEMGVLAASGHKEVVVAQQLSIGVLSIGNNLEEPGKPLKSGYIYDISKITIISLLKDNDFSSSDFGIVNNTSSSIIKNIEKALDKVDILVTLGSANDKDLLKKILLTCFEAEIHFGNVNIKPGKSTTLATCKINDKIKYFLCLSGNPVTAFIAAQVLLLPFLRKMSCNEYAETPVLPIHVNIPFILHHRPRLACTYLKWSKDNVAMACNMGNLFKDKLCNIVGSNALLMLPESENKEKAIFNDEKIPGLLIDYPRTFNLKKD
ncbi:PREDICTED: molybdenum cofactor synthesis protein cinnamon-like [Trachymyrmex cornetzi]|uniref:molybdenum cofactor synthesis protein cinnamon-like n=1 Tax=Trachymyrmex cornetzi TaxID=471704 RepID=UPI00084EFA3B|nr:PREDICTED: molybdenum cofactor synthesis protein cinnamon-like [Trachymyrmex cornetzi]